MTTIEFILLALIGNMAHVLAKLAKLEKTKDFSLAVWIKENFFTTIFGVVASAGVVFILKSMGQLTEGAAIMGGYMSDSIIKNASKGFANKFKK